jgi:hypothetical protein
MQYYSLISSLPMLLPDGEPGITPEKFLSDCRPYLNERNFRILETLSLDPVPEDFPTGSFARKYSEWECSLRNAIVRARAEKNGTDPLSSLNRNAGMEADSERAVSSAYAAKSPLERERILDEARWIKIEELECGKPFSFEQICGYKLKLLIRQKWSCRKETKAAENLELAAEKIRIRTKSETIQQEFSI